MYNTGHVSDTTSISASRILGPSYSKLVPGIQLFKQDHQNYDGGSTTYCSTCAIVFKIPNLIAFPQQSILVIGL